MYRDNCWLELYKNERYYVYLPVKHQPPVGVRIRDARAKIAKITPKTIHFIDLLQSSPLMKF